tara:strand:+ start:78 stop:518 length:441 start_codon:yes stop_codon:yes gene_type:complete
MKYVLNFVVVSCLALSGLQAKDGAEAAQSRFDELSRETSFRAGFSTPDLLDPAIMPYLQCLNPEMGVVAPDEKFDPREFDDEADCSAERETAKREAVRILSNEGIDDPAMQETLIGETLFVIELQNRSMTEYKKSRRYSASGPVHD